MTDFGTLTMVGLIATVLSIGFAMAAFINSRRRLGNKPDESQDAAPDIPLHVPGEQKPASVRPAQAPYYNTTNRRVSGGEHTQPAFKQVQPLGAQSGQQDTSNSGEYLWE